MKNEIIEKVNKIGKAGQIITRIGKVILIMGFVVCLISAVFLCIIPKDMITIKMSHHANINVDLKEAEKISNMIIIDDEDVETSVEINDIRYEVSDYEKNSDEIKIYADAKTHEIAISNIWWVMIPGMVSIVAIYIVLSFIEKLCKLFMTCETPFTDEVVKVLKNLAISIIPMSFLSPLTESIADSMLTGSYNITVGIDLMTVVLIVLIFMLAAIFKYGTMLQIESDETL